MRLQDCRVLVFCCWLVSSVFISPLAWGQTQVASGQARPGQQYWLDFDPGCGGVFYEDVDDCWALFYFLAKSPVALSGVSTVFGNTSGELAFRNAEKWIQELKRSRPPMRLPPLYQGRSQPVGFSSVISPAEQALQQQLTGSSDHAMTLILMGPVSNAASILKTRPALIRKVQRIVMLGGQFRGDSHWIPVKGRLSMRDYNVIKDPLAMQWLLETGIPIDFIPVTAAFSHLLNAEKLSVLGHKEPAIDWLKKESLAWERFWRWGFGMEGFPAFDLLAAGLVLEPEKFTCKRYDALMGHFPNWVGQAPGLLFVAASPETGKRARYQRCELTRGKALDLLKLAAAAQSQSPGNH